MAGFGIKTDNVTARNFTTGFGKVIFDWCTETFSNHGPAWYIWDDQRAALTNPYFVMCDQAAPTPMSKAMFFQVMVDSTTNQLILQPYLYWNNSTQTGLGQFQRLLLATYDTQFTYHLCGGPNLIFLATRSGGTTRHARISKWEGWWDGVWKLLQPESASGTLTDAVFKETDPGGYLSGYHNLTGYESLLDASGKLYFNIVLVSGSTYRIDIYKDAARNAPNLIGHTGNFTNSSTGSKSVTADNSSGLGGSIGTDITVAAATNIDCRFLRLDLGSGEGANFIAGRRYTLFYMTTTSLMIRNVTVTSKSGDQLVINAAGANNFPAGAMISPYPHRWVCSGSQQSGSFNGPAQIPYPTSSQGNENTAYAGSPAYKSVGYDWLQSTFAALNPDPMGHYVVMEPLIFENYQASSGNRAAYGSEIETRLGGNAALSNLSDNRIIDSDPWLAFDVSNSGLGYAWMVRNWESLS